MSFNSDRIHERARKIRALAAATVMPSALAVSTTERSEIAQRINASRSGSGIDAKLAKGPVRRHLPRQLPSGRRQCGGPPAPNLRSARRVRYCSRPLQIDRPRFQSATRPPHREGSIRDSSSDVLMRSSRTALRLFCSYFFDRHANSAFGVRRKHFDHQLGFRGGTPGTLGTSVELECAFAIRK